MVKFVALKVSRALLARALFAVHGIVGVWRLYVDTKSLRYWLLALAPISLFLEGAVTILRRHGDEYKWFCPSVFIFLCGSVPPIWFLEISTTVRIINNQTVYDPHDDSDAVLAGYLKVMFPLSQREIWLKLLEQSLLVVLILGRWLLPKGRISRDELSQLLLAYLAISADIAELFNLFNEVEIRKNFDLTIVTLAVWSVSLIQFPMVMTTVKSQKARYCWPSNAKSAGEEYLSVVTSPSRCESVVAKTSLADRLMEKFTDTSAWGILSTVVLQDGPFFALRIYLLVWAKLYNYTLFFFISKNSLIITIQLYRLIVICCDRPSSTAAPILADVRRSSTASGARERALLLQDHGRAPSTDSKNGTTDETSSERPSEPTLRLCSSELIDL